MAHHSYAAMGPTKKDSVAGLAPHTFYQKNFSENGAKSGSGVIYTLIYQNENGMSYMQG